MNFDQYKAFEDERSAKETQVGGSHYKQYAIQPIEFITKNNLDFCEGNVIKYTVRHEDKGGEADIDKAIHYLNLIKELKYGNRGTK